MITLIGILAIVCSIYYTNSLVSVKSRKVKKSYGAIMRIVHIVIVCAAIIGIIILNQIQQDAAIINWCKENDLPYSYHNRSNMGMGSGRILVEGLGSEYTIHLKGSDKTVNVIVGGWITGFMGWDVHLSGQMVQVP
jgi:hypothetical protein